MVSAVALTSCKDFLTEVPVTSTSQEIQLSSLENCNIAAAGAYSLLASTSWYGESFILEAEMATMNGKKYLGSKRDSGRYNDEYFVNYTPTSTSPLWAAAYSVIDEANKVLNSIDKVAGDQQTKDNIKGEMLALRSLGYMDLVRTYAMPYNYTKDASHLGVPIHLNGNEFRPKPSDYPARSSVKEVYKQIVSDLLNAEKIMSDDYQRAGVADGRATVTKPVVQAFLARAYQYCEKWDSAAVYATKVIDNKKYTLWTAADLQDAACYRVDVSTSGESIFEVYGNRQNSADGFHDSLWSQTAPDGEYGDCGVSQDLVDLFEPNDVRLQLFNREDDKGVGYATLKYGGKPNVPSPYTNNVFVIRLSEMYLIRAEAALNKAATTSSAVDDLNAIAARCGATPQKPTLDGVYTELAKEFAWEGHLWYDLARTGRDMTRVDVAGTAIKNLPAGDYRWAKPISSIQLERNTNLVQNEGYK